MDMRQLTAEGLIACIKKCYPDCTLTQEEIAGMLEIPPENQEGQDV